MQPQCLFTGPHISFFGADPYQEQIPAASASTCCYLCAVRMLPGVWPAQGWLVLLLLARMLPDGLPPLFSLLRCLVCPHMQETPKCVAFEFNERVGGGTCFLKDGTGIVPRALEGAQSGVLIQPGTPISAEAVLANHAATTGVPAAVGSTKAAALAKAAGAAGASGSSPGNVSPSKALQLGSSLSAASSGRPGGNMGRGEVPGRQLQQ